MIGRPGCYSPESGTPPIWQSGESCKDAARSPHQLFQPVLTIQQNPNSGCHLIQLADEVRTTRNRSDSDFSHSEGGRGQRREVQEVLDNVVQSDCTTGETRYRFLR